MENQYLKAPSDRVTIRHVAEHAGVSVAAVSKVLRNAYGVSDALRLKVEAAIERLEYRPSTAARAMRGRTYTVGILVVELTNPFLPGVLEGLDAQLATANYKTMIGVGRGASAIEASMIETMIDNRMDGLVIVAPQITGKLVERYALQIPMITIAHHEPAATSYDTVNSDDYRGGVAAVQALAAKGYRDIAMIGYDRSNSPHTIVAAPRELGYQAAMEELGLAGHARILRLPVPGEPRDDAIASLLTAPDRPRAMFVWSDLDAIRILAAATEAGIRVPEDLAIMGYDNSPVAALSLVNLSSIHQNPGEIGRVAGGLMLSRIEGRTEAQHVQVPPEVVIRRSM